MLLCSGDSGCAVGLFHRVHAEVWALASRDVAGFPSLLEPYDELGANDVDKRRHYPVDRLTSRLERWGYRVHLDPARVSFFQGNPREA